MAPSNRLFCGDNLQVLQEHVADESIDLVYIDPPFFSQRHHRTRRENGGFSDIWTWDGIAQSDFESLCAEVLAPGEKERREESRRGRHECPRHQSLALLLAGLEPVVGRGSLLAYLVSVGRRLVELERVLRPTGNIFLHCDPTASHYLKLLLDAVFGAPGFRNEIVWCYSHGGKSRKWFARKHDIIFFYAKSPESYFDPNAVRAEMRSGKHSFGGRLLTGEDGRKYRLVYGTRNSHGVARYYKYFLDEGKLPEDWWADINSLQASAAERTGYPTQKPEALVARIVAACSRPGDTVLDAYCGSGTTLVAAERLARAWVGIDVSSDAIALTERRLGELQPVELKPTLQPKLQK
jgi:DNA modification methylase